MKKRKSKILLKTKLIFTLCATISITFLFAIIIVSITTLISGILAAISGSNSESSLEYTTSSYGQAYDLSSNTQMFTSELYEACEKYNALQWYELLKAIMEIESGGEGPEWKDRMCCSESQENYEYPRCPGAITSSKYSMDTGVRTWLSLCRYTGLKNAGEENLLLATVQCYNYGPGFWDYLNQKDSGFSGKFSIHAAESYQKNFNALYGWEPGNSEYTNKFREHFKFPKESSSIDIGGKLGWPIDFKKCTTYPNHLAIDIPTETTGHPVYAVGDGVVIWTYHYPYNIWGSDIDDERSWGNYVRIYYPNLGIQTGYAHLNSINVSVGQTVNSGQIIAYSGNTGNSSGPHLHYEIYEFEGSTLAPSSTRIDAQDFRKYYPKIVIN